MTEKCPEEYDIMFKNKLSSDISVNFCSNQCMNSWFKAKHLFSEVIVTLNNLNSSSKWLISNCNNCNSNK